MTIPIGNRVTGIAVDRDNREKDDFYRTPPIATNALLRVERFAGPIWECACGDGAISRVLQDAGYDVVSTDLVDHGYGERGVDFLMETRALAPNIVTNPPFKNSGAFMRHALQLSTGKVALLLRLGCLEGADRLRIYELTPPARIWVFSRRITMQRGNDATGQRSGMLAFAWFVWEHSYQGRPTLGWL